MNSGDTAWVLTATALVLLMTIPGLAFFYGGLGPPKKCSLHSDAVFHYHVCHQPAMDAFWIFSGLWSFFSRNHRQLGLGWPERRRRRAQSSLTPQLFRIPFL